MTQFDPSKIKGINVSTAEGGTDLALTRRYWPDRDIHVLSGAGFNAARIFFQVGELSTAVILDLCQRFAAAGLVPMLNPRNGGKDWTIVQKFWQAILPMKGLPVSTILDVWNEPFQFDSATWTQKVQPELCSAIRKLDPNRTLVVHNGGYEGIAGYPPFVPDFAMPLPSGPFVIGLHDYAAQGEGSDDWNLSHFKAWLDKLGVGALLTEYGGDDSMAWGDWIDRVAEKSRIHAKYGLGGYLWMHKTLFENDTPGARTLRPDTLAAISLPTYQAPTRTDSPVLQPVGSVKWPSTRV